MSALGRTGKASLTAITSLCQTLIGLLIGLVITPLLVHYLNPTGYGIWLYLIQFVGFLAVVDIFPSSSLKLQLAIHRHVNEASLKRELVGAHLVLATCALPIYILIGVIAVPYLPLLLGSSALDVSELQSAAIVLLSISALNKILTTPALILRGENLDYKANMLRSVVVLLTALADLVTVLYGYGLIGLALNKLVFGIIQATLLLAIAKRHVAWIGTKIPKRDQVKEMFKLNWWIYITNAASNLGTGTDLLILGTYLSPVAVTVYSLTGTLSRFGNSLFVPVLQSANAGLGELHGQGDKVRLREVREVLELGALILAVPFGVACAWINMHFIRIWVGEQYFGGMVLNVELVLLATLTLMVKMRQNLLNSILDVKSIAKIFVASAVMTIVVAVVSCPWLGPPGVALGGILGAGVALLGYDRALKLAFDDKSLFIVQQRRLVLISLGLIYLAGVGSVEIFPETWFMLIIWSGVAGIFSFVVLWWLGISSPERSKVSLYFKRSLTPLGLKLDKPSSQH